MARRMEPALRGAGIQWLRSPAMAHPDVFDAWSLMAFARAQGRSAEMQPAGADQWKDTGRVEVLGCAGCGAAEALESAQAIRGLQDVGSGLFGLPSSSLFSDFCAELSSRLPHTFVRERAAFIEGCDGAFEVRLADGRSIKSRSLVLALGFPGPAIVPSAFAGLPADVAFHTEDCDRLSTLAKGQRVLVIGGGLTAVQTAQLAMRKGCHTTLCSRRHLVTRQFDIWVSGFRDLPLQWFDFRSQGHLRHAFWSEPAGGRLAKIRATRGGGSVPPSYMEQLRAAEAAGQLRVVLGEVEACSFEGGVVETTLRGEDQRLRQGRVSGASRWGSVQQAGVSQSAGYCRVLQSQGCMDPGWRAGSCRKAPSSSTGSCSPAGTGPAAWSSRCSPISAGGGPPRSRAGCRSCRRTCSGAA
ncbi:unnamed protein product [Prorocentrum cordatum]|uniref:FAD/NAD(P)-binding domain-containing protein n=1 Tax=Prorocentrum cordatum TaxID=2364126 RepID=A0ABN9W372_9DINO|nr:unnamed protein product [Polarella glacialis]